MLPVIEQFLSIDGEGPTAGELAYFVRFSDCNLRCSWCDTVYSWDGSCQVTHQTAQQIYDAIAASGSTNVTLTGGEPLLQPELVELLRLLARDGRHQIHIETNGSLDIAPWRAQAPWEQIHYILDYKLPESGMEHRMCLANLWQVTDGDVYKFVIASQADLQRAIEVVQQHQLTQRCLVYFSPVRECIDPLELVEAMKDRQLNGVRLQLQLHKIIWPKEMRGV